MMKFTEQHEWVSVDNQFAKVGITDFAQNQLGDIVFVELPEVGLKVNKGDEACVVESVKAAAEVYSPVSGEVTEINSKLVDDPALINTSAEQDAWLFAVKLSNPQDLDNLMEKEAYNKYIAELI